MLTFRCDYCLREYVARVEEGFLSSHYVSYRDNLHTRMLFRAFDPCKRCQDKADRAHDNALTALKEQHG